jgi:peptide/nickel transport system ATP-binding protein
VFADPKHPYTRELLRSTISLSTTGLNFIPGAPPDLVDPPPGCRFHPRCPDGMRVCREKFPINLGLSSGQRVECWLHSSERVERELLPTWVMGASSQSGTLRRGSG